MSPSEVETLLNKQSGLLGISGLTNDMRELLAELKEHDDRRVRLAIEIFCYRARKYIGAYLAAMGGADAIVFTGGIGENSPEIRARICEGMEWAGLTIDAAKNQQTVGQRRPDQHRRFQAAGLRDPDRRRAADRARHGAGDRGRAASVVKAEFTTEARRTRKEISRGDSFFSIEPKAEYA